MKKKIKIEKIGLRGRINLSKKKRDVLFNSFVNDLTATQAYKMAEVNRNTANLYYNQFRQDIADTRKHPPLLFGNIEMDQAFFGSRTRNKYNKKRKLIRKSKNNKVIVFGILKRNGEVYTEIIKRADKRVLVPIIKKVVKPKSRIYTDSWRAFNRLVDNNYKHIIINHSRGLYDKKGNHINNIESFWSFCKRRLSQFNGISRDLFELHMKECEFRYVHRKHILKAMKSVIK